LFGGETLKDFAFAPMVGIASGAYSSIFIASPVLTHWKEREGSIATAEHGSCAISSHVPAYATTLEGAPIDVEPARKAGAAGAGQLDRPEEPASRSPRTSSTRWCAT
jgi:SecD/SecF fusion protein